MPGLPLIYADFHNADAQGRVRLNCVGTISDLSRQQVQLREGLVLGLYADDANEVGQEDRLIVDGIVAYSAEEQCWVAVIDWHAIQHETGLASSPSAPASPIVSPGGTPVHRA